MKNIILGAFFFSCFKVAIAQESWNSHFKQILFIATDKTLYTNSETIWFAGYILKDVQGYESAADMLIVSLIETASKKNILQKKYLLLNGFCSGSLLLPDSIKSGSYELYAFTNLVDTNKIPIGEFHRHITIKSDYKNSFKASYEIQNSLMKDDSVKIAVKVFSNDIKIASHTIIQYFLSNKKTESLKLDNFGRGAINFKRKDLSEKKLHLIALFNNEKQEDYISLPNPESEKNISIKFFPEGGYLIKQIPNHLIWEAKNGNGQPQKIKACLLDGEKILDTIETNENGIGEFFITPNINDNYTLKIITDNQSNIYFPLPASLNSGIALNVKQAIVDDTLHINMHSDKHRIVTIQIRNLNFDSSLNFEQVEIQSNRNVSIPLSNVIKGLNAITIFDADGKPLVERLFFAHYDHKTIANIETDSFKYNIRKQIKVSVHLVDKNNNPIKQGIMSVACVQRNRIETAYQNDIESYYFIGHLFDSISYFVSSKRFFESKSYLENLLLTKGWRKYTWQNDNLLQKEITGINKLSLSGRIVKNDKPLKKPETLILFKNTSITSFPTDSEGKYVLNVSQIAVPENKYIYLVIDKRENFQNFGILQDSLPEKESRERIPTLLFDEPIKQPVLNNALEVLQSDFNGHALKDVSVKSNDKNVVFGSNACGDYVCLYNVLNCPNHPTGPHTLPIAGNVYYSPGDGKKVVYEGCNTASLHNASIRKIDGVYYAREFYGMDSLTLTQPDIQTMSTIYWNPFVVTDDNGTAHFSFYTSDVKDYFNIVVQGVSVKDLFYNEKTIQVN